MNDPQSSINMGTAIALVAASGALGGIVNCAISGEFSMPFFDKTARVWRPGWIGNVLLGFAAALAVWGIYGPLASFDLAHPDGKDFHLTLAQLFTSLVIGLSGGKILTLMAEKNAERVAKNQLATVLESLVPTTPPGGQKP